MKVVFCLLLSIPMFLKSQIDNGSKGIKWEAGSGWEKVKEKARSEGKYIFVDCYATWCGPCKMMDRNVFSNSYIGNEMNAKFVCVKIQIDTNDSDDEQVTKWYTDAKMIVDAYKISAVPTYLFFNSEGKLVHLSGGYQDGKSFLNLAKLAQDPQKLIYYSLYENYRCGHKDYGKLGALAIFTKDMIGDEKLSQVMAADYKSVVLDKLNDIDLLTKETFEFLRKFYGVISTSDKIFNLCYYNQAKVDSVSNSGSAKEFVNATIIREEIENGIIEKEKSFVHYPNWEKIQDNIRMKFDRIDARLLVLDYKIKYYRYKFLDWKLWAKYKNDKIKLYPPTIDSYKADWKVGGDLNQFGAWDAFLNCNDKRILKQALRWINLALKFNGNNANYMDTKANLLYKLGQNEMAVKLQQRAVTLDPGSKWKNDALAKMKSGVPTWSK